MGLPRGGASPVVVKLTIIKAGDSYHFPTISPWGMWSYGGKKTVLDALQMLVMPLIFMFVGLVYTWWIWLIWLGIVLVQQGAGGVVRHTLGLFCFFYVVARGRSDGIVACGDWSCTGGGVSSAIRDR